MVLSSRLLMSPDSILACKELRLVEGVVTFCKRINSASHSERCRTELRTEALLYDNLIPFGFSSSNQCCKNFAERYLFCSVYFPIQVPNVLL